MVCDGMGGAAAGEVASSLAVEEMLRRLTDKTSADHKPRLEKALEAISSANETIYLRSRRNYRLNGMGTTMVALVADGHQLWLLNIGDSRGYRLRNRQLEQISLDHSLVDEQVRAGRMTAEEAARSPLRNVITRALGTQNSTTPDIFEMEAVAGDIFLLCSDGLTRELSDEAIESILLSDSETSPVLSELCSRLVNEAKKAGGRDNITCLLVRVE
jgi:PPM family protein phosphatase